MKIPGLICQTCGEQVLLESELIDSIPATQFTASCHGASLMWQVRMDDPDPEQTIRVFCARAEQMPQMEAATCS